MPTTTLTPEALGRALAAVRAALGLDDQAEIPTRTYDALIAGWHELQAAQAEAEQPVALDAIPEPSQECYSDDGDSWCDDPADVDFVAGLDVGDTYELMVSHYSVQRTYVVTKVPDDHSDDYEAEPRPSPQVREDDSQGKANG